MLLKIDLATPDLTWPRHTLARLVMVIDTQSSLPVQSRPCHTRPILGVPCPATPGGG
jgi:hypothetical protein